MLKLEFKAEAWIPNLVHTQQCLKCSVGRYYCVTREGGNQSCGHVTVALISVLINRRF